MRSCPEDERRRPGAAAVDERDRFLARAIARPRALSRVSWYSSSASGMLMPPTSEEKSLAFLETSTMSSYFVSAQ